MSAMIFCYDYMKRRLKDNDLTLIINFESLK